MVHGQNPIGEKMNINIKKTFEDDFTTRVAGERLRNLILKANDTVSLDFENLKVASASFFDEGLAKLAKNGWKKEDYENKLTLKNIYKMDLKLLASTCKARGVSPKFKIN